MRTLIVTRVEQPVRARSSEMASDCGGADQLEKTRSLLQEAVESLAQASPSTSSAFPARPGTTGATAPRSDTARERNRLFNFKRKPGCTKASYKSKKKRISTWNHEFICLASRSTAIVPSGFEMAELMRGGLGRKQLSLFEDDGVAELHAEILCAFPTLKDAGGYELLRVSGCGARSALHLIPQPAEGYTVTYLKEAVRQAKVYIRPLQRDLTVTPETSLLTSKSDCPTEECGNCSKLIPLPQLREHIEGCKKQEDDGGLIEDDYTREDFQLPLDILEGDGKCCSDEQPGLAEVEEAMIQQAVRASTGFVMHKETTDFSADTLKDIVTSLQSKIGPDTYEFQVRRNHLFHDLVKETKKRAFHPSKLVSTYFIGEEGNDTGGLTRELWRLFGKYMQESLLEGKKNCMVIRHDASKLQEGTFRQVGMLIGISLVQGGSGYPFFAPSTYSYFCGHDLRTITIGRDEMPDLEIDIMLDEIVATNDDDVRLREMAMKHSDVLLSCGFTKPLATLCRQDVPLIIECVMLHTALLQVKAELDQIKEGLSDAGVLEMMTKHPDLFKPLFVHMEDPLTADRVMGLFQYRMFSEAGTSELQKEQATYMHFRDLLEELESGVKAEEEETAPFLYLGDCLSFFTGANRIPPTGFDGCTLNFSSTSMFPTASTCALTLTLPTKYHNNYHDFKEKVIFGFYNHGGFGLC